MPNCSIGNRFFTGKHKSLFPGVLALALIAGACEEKNAYVAPPPPKVNVAQPERKPVTEYLDFTGNIAAVQTVQLRARVEGYLEQVLFARRRPGQEGRPAVPDRTGPLHRGGRPGEGQRGPGAGGPHAGEADGGPPPPGRSQRRHQQAAGGRGGGPGGCPGGPGDVLEGRLGDGRTQPRLHQGLRAIRRPHRPPARGSWKSGGRGRRHPARGNQPDRARLRLFYH